ncbi:MBL fold metallo-hydrolase [Desulfosporosinus sp.]|uniref:MBL fold metallo-hydrolase n=1 Tax=Desulfosporosinus sp. TaxID=157907 RepID=UPI0025BCCDE4|nr:MBL fold metallo-hydrolase [Desulfosporosinus sp.]MBC2722579.1 MBL fold metallo-hydrolase [Desulfosporosinus sp.]MBC2729138.1 MBL fold metallo-hydrolase [Desulfosporosinus sp.]
MSYRIKWLILPIIIFSLILSGCGKTQTTTPEIVAETPTRTTEVLKVHFLDVGQADSTLLVTPSGDSILIDGGNNEDGPEIVSYLRSQGVKELSAIVATHPHEDHIGGLDLVIQSIPTKTVYMPNADSNTRTFEDFIAAVKASGAKKVQAKVGVGLNVSELTGVFLAPNSSSYEELNNYSAVLKVTYGKVSFLFEGDAEDISEAEMLKSGQDLKATVLKVGHHGSNSSTTSAFLRAVSPKHAIISVGADNEYGHPTPTILDRIAQAGITTYRTDKSGTIVVTTNGETIEFDKKASIQQNAPATDSTSTPESKVVPVPESALSPTPSSATSKSSVELSNIDLRGEVVTITNPSRTDVDLTGWKLVSEVGNQTFIFPSGTTLTAGGSIKIVSGEKARAGVGTLVWTQSNIWNNNGDPGALYDAQGQLTATR